MPERTMSSNEYRYGFNGKEKDEDEEWGDLTHYDYGFRIYNPGIGRFLSVDPLTREYPWFTPYQFAANTPIQAIDLDGAEALFTPRRIWEFENSAEIGTISINNESVFVTNSDPHQTGAWVPIPSLQFLNDTYNSVEKGIAAAREEGSKYAADNLERWLKGTGGVVKFPVDEFMQIDGFIKKLDKNTHRFFSVKNSKTGENLWTIGLDMSEGESTTYSDYFDTNVTFPLLTRNDRYRDLYYSWGTIKVVSQGNFDLSVEDGILTISGTITHNLSDDYNWNPGNETPIKGAGNVSDNDLLLLEVYKGAKPFKGEGEVIERINVQYDLNKRKIINDSSTKEIN